MPVLDTCFVIDFLRGDPGAVRLLTLLQQGSRPLGITAHTEFELFAGIGRSRQPDADKQPLESFLAELVRFPFTSEAARTAGLLEAQLASKGQRPAILDLLIGCTALHAGEPVVTRDRNPFQSIPGLEVLAY
ncbi:MAG: PIN domain-containing protein [Candidatus Thermoplasmatota archaeon]|jgi:predicted nucleic acid-binding protein